MFKDNLVTLRKLHQMTQETLAEKVGVTTVGDKGQIVIPAKARKLFSIKTGDQLVVLGDEAQGLALLKSENFLQMAEIIRNGMK